MKKENTSTIRKQQSNTGNKRQYQNQIKKQNMKLNKDFIVPK